jgi:xanthine dehydrogenase molybdenum-binding subunit
MREEFSIVGKRLPRVDALEKVTGRGKFVVDMKIPGMLYAMIVRSPYAHAKVLSIKPERAKKLPGVKAILSMEDVPRISYDSSCPPILNEAIRDQYVFDEKVRFVGEGVAAVAATSEDIAEEAIKLIKIEYQELPAVFDPEEAMKKDAPRIHSFEHNVAGKVDFEFGDLNKGFKEADYIFKDRYTTSRVQHCSLEPHACICSFNESRKLTVWTSTQIPFRARIWMAIVLDMHVGDIRVIKPHTGGGFGGKEEICQELICALLSKKTGKPIKSVYSREEEFYATRTRHPCIIELETGVKKDGELTARQIRAILNTGAYASHGLGVLRVLSSTFLVLYRSPNVRFNGCCVYTNTPVAGAMRAFGAPQVTFAVESQMDTIADKLEIDPIKLRLKNAMRTGDVVPGTNMVIGSCGLKECLEKGAKKIHWETRQKPGKASGIKKLGLGVAQCVFQIASVSLWPEHAAAFIKMNEDGTADLLTGASDIGQGSSTVLAQICAEELGIRLEDVHVTEGDTAITPFELGTYGSRVTYTVGGAVKAAAADAKRRLLQSASRILGADPSDLEVKNGLILVTAKPDKTMPIAKVIGASQSSKSGATSIIGSASFEPAANAFAFGAQFAEVEVDVETGQVRLLKIVAAHDVGRAINPMAVEGQIEGGVHMGIGYTLTEELIIDKATGKTRNPTFLDYKIPGSLDIPEIFAIIVEDPDPNGPYGAKGIGEPPTIPTAPAIANAIYNATGARIKELPITPEKILKSLKTR